MSTHNPPRSAGTAARIPSSASAARPPTTATAAAAAAILGRFLSSSASAAASSCARFCRSRLRGSGCALSHAAGSTAPRSSLRPASARRSADAHPPRPSSHLTTTCCRNPTRRRAVSGALAAAVAAAAASAASSASACNSAATIAVICSRRGRSVPRGSRAAASSRRATSPICICPQRRRATSLAVASRHSARTAACSCSSVGPACSPLLRMKRRSSLPLPSSAVRHGSRSRAARLAVV